MELEKLISVIADVLNMDTDKITGESKFVDDLGADSLDVFEIIVAIEEEYGIEVPTDEAEKIVTVNDAYNAIKAVME